MKVENRIHIRASSEAVWAVTEDVESWPEWTDNFESVKLLEGRPFGPGASARIKQPRLAEAVWTVASWKEGEGFSWRSRLRGIPVLATHELRPTPGGTENVLRVEATGCMAFLLWPILRPSFRKALERENTGLKNRCEGSGR